MGFRHTDLFALFFHVKVKECFMTATCFYTQVLELYQRFQLNWGAIDGQGCRIGLDWRTQAAPAKTLAIDFGLKHHAIIIMQ